MKTTYLTLADLGAALKKNLTAILLGAVLLFAVGFGIGAIAPETYSSSFSCQVRYMQGEEFIKVNGLTSSQLSSVQTLCKEYAVMVNTHDALYLQILPELDGTYTVEELKAMVRAVADSTQLVVTVSHSDPAAVKDVAAALTEAVPAYINREIWPNVSSMDAVIPAASAGAPARSSLHPLTVGALAGLAGALVLYLFFLLRFLFGNRLCDEREVTRALPETALLGTLRCPVGVTEDADWKPEGIHALRTNVTVRLKDTGCPVVGVVEHSNAILANQLAFSLSGAEKRVLVLDFCHRPDGPSAGLLDYLEGREASLDALLHPSECAEGVLRLAVGNAQNAAPQDLLATNRFRTLLKGFTEVMDAVLLSLPDADTAALLSSAVTGYVLSVPAGIADVRLLRRVHAVLQNAEANILGLVVYLPPQKPSRIRKK